MIAPSSIMRNDPLRRDFRIMNDGTGKTTGDQIAVVGIGAIGIDLARQRQTEFSPGPLRLLAGHHHEDQVAVDGADRARHGFSGDRDPPRRCCRARHGS